MDLFTRLLDISTGYGGHIAVLLMLGLLLASGMGLPLPEDVPLLISGYLCYSEIVSLKVMIPLTFLAVVGADSIIYFLGRRYGHLVPRLPLLRRYLSPSRLQRAELAFHEHGGKTLFVARFLPGVRAPVFFTAGIFKIPYWKFLAFDGTAALISVPLLVLVGYIAGENIERAKHSAEVVQSGIIIVIVLLAIGFISWKVLRHRRAAAKLARQSVSPPPAPAPAPPAKVVLPDPAPGVRSAPSRPNP